MLGLLLSSFRYSFNKAYRLEVQGTELHHKANRLYHEGMELAKAADQLQDQELANKALLKRDEALKLQGEANDLLAQATKARYE